MEPTLTSALAQAAFKAVVGPTVQASTPVLRRLLKRVRNDPKLVRRFEAWREVRITQEQEKVITKFLSSRECQGLLEMLAFIEYNKSPYWNTEREELREAFRQEMASRLTVADSDLELIATDFWALAEGAIRLEVKTVQAQGVTDSTSIYSRALLTDRLFPDYSSLKLPITARASISNSSGRVSSALSLAREIKTAARHSFSSMKMPHSREDYRVKMDEIYVHRSLRPAKIDTRQRLITYGRAKDAVRDNRLHFRSTRLAILGTPGAGKTTYVRYLVYWLASHEDPGNAHAPILIELKYYSRRESDFIASITAKLTTILQSQVNRSTVEDLLTLGYCTVIFDGIDEIAELEVRRSAVANIENFCRRYPLVKTITTSREVGYLSAPLDNNIFAAYIMPEFDNAQVKAYVTRWFELVDIAPDSKIRTSNFLSESQHIHDLRANPLMLSLLCLLYVYDGWIPQNRLQVYEECTTLLFRRWDQVRGVANRRAGTRQIWFLFQELAYWYLFKKGNAVATDNRIRSVIEKFLKRAQGNNRIGTSLTDAGDFLDYCAGRAWLLNHVGETARGERIYDFTHRTFMEYFAACYITRHSETTNDLVLQIAEIIQQHGSDIVAQIALQHYDDNVAGGLEKAVEGLLNLPMETRSVALHFLLNSLDYIDPVRTTLRRLCQDALLFSAHERNDQIAVDLARLPKAYQLTLREISENLMKSTNSNLQDRGFDHFVGGIGYLITSRSESVADRAGPKFFFDRDAVAYGNLRALKDLAANQPHIVSEMLTQGYLSVNHYIQVLGARAMLVPPANLYLAKPVEAPLVAELQSVATSSRISASLFSMLDQILETPSCILPITPQAVDNLRGSLDGVHKSSLPREVRFALTITVICAAHDLELNWASDVRRLGVMINPSASRVQLHSHLFSLATRTMNAAWQTAIKEWGIGKLVFGSRDGAD